MTYRTPIEKAYNEIKTARYVVSYDGMWHYISKNFGKPHIIPSKEGVTTYNTPNAVKIHFGDDFKKCFEEENMAETLTRMRNTSQEWKNNVGGNIKSFEKKI